MWKRVILLTICLLSIPTPMLADTTADVTVTATGYIVGVSELTITWITDTQIQIDWVMGDNVTNVMLRAKIGSLPDDREDGYLVYTGNATTFTDTAVNLDEIATYVYYRLWSQGSGGVWEEEGDSGWIGGQGMILIAIIMMCAMVSYFSLRSSNILLALGASLTWLFFLYYTRDNPIGGITTGGTADELIVYLCWIFAILLPLIAIGRGRRERRYFGDDKGSVEWGESRRLEPNPNPPRSMSTMEERNNVYRARVRSALRRKTR